MSDHLDWIREADIEAIPVDLDEYPDGWDDADDPADVVDEADFVIEVPEFSDLLAWCPTAEDWVARWRPPNAEPDEAWFCRVCGQTDHVVQDHEGDGA